jgi:hypothetical protein
VIVEGSLTKTQDMTCTYDPKIYASPPPGFFDTPPMKPSASSWAQSVN